MVSLVIIFGACLLYTFPSVIGLASDQNQTQPLTIIDNSTTLGNGTARTAVGAENEDVKNILPNPIVIEQKQPLPIRGNGTTLGNGTSGSALSPLNPHPEAPIMPEQVSQLEPHEEGIIDQSKEDKVKDVSSKDVSSKDVSSKTKDQVKEISTKVKDKVKHVYEDIPFKLPFS